MKEVLRYALVADGTSDVVLKEIIEWAMLRMGRVGTGEFFARSSLRGKKLGAHIGQVIGETVDLDLLFVHRDVEGDTLQKRVDEIKAATEGMSVPTVPVVPVRMSEAWLLCDEQAIRAAAGNPNGKMALDMPALGSLEAIADPKATIYDLLRTATSTRGRIRKTAKPSRQVKQVTAYTEDFAPLLKLESFRRFYDALEVAVSGLRD